MKIHIFPVPKKVSCSVQPCELSGAGWIVLPEQSSSRLRNRAMDVARRLSRMLAAEVRVALAVPNSGKVLLKAGFSADFSSDQAYELSLTPSERVIRAGGEAGMYYGLLALLQIVEQYGSRTPSVRIKDEPDFPVRGVMLDVTRCKVPTMETCKLLIDRLSGLRINQLQLYIEHAFAFTSHKTVWHDASPFTHEEIIELDQYCADRFIELVPNLNSFGHFERWLRHPEYRHLGECPERQNCGVLAPNSESLKLLGSLYDEYLPHFRSRIFNVGCDETWELGEGRSKVRAAKTGTTHVYFEFLKKIHKEVTKRGRRMQFWGDIIRHQPELIPQLPKDIIALCWGYQADHPYSVQCPQFEKAGLEYYVCPGTSAWNSILGKTDNCLANLENAAINGLKYGATGYLNTDWGDGGHHQVLPISYIGFTAGAGYSWNVHGTKGTDIAGMVSRHFLCDETGMLGRVLFDMGQTMNRIKGLSSGNSSNINRLLFAKPENVDLKKVTRTQLDQAHDWLEKAESNICKSKPAASDSDLVFAELRHSIAMGRHAVNRGRYLRFGDVTIGQLRRELQGLIMSHEEQWLARNRPGGLHESSERLRRTAVSIQ